jgi:protein-S-isoprenylcysteine O-methyltransferase Ste14
VNFVYRYLFSSLWLGWGLYWWALSRNVKPVARTESMYSRLSHIVPLAIAAILIGLPRIPLPALGDRLLPLAAWPFWIGAVLTAAGLLFTVWARVHIGTNWSGIVTVKENHELIQSGPYGIVRHPIYTGLLVAIVGSGIARGEWRGVIAVVIVLWAFSRKLQTEERYMREQFGDAYRTYSKRVPALIPGFRNIARR